MFLVTGAVPGSYDLTIFTMKILILGASGMLGHQLWLALQSRHDVSVTLRGKVADYLGLANFPTERVFERINATDFSRVAMVLEQVRPDVVINCVGIIKQLKESKSAVQTITLNALLPHQLAEWCDRRGSRLLHFSTDCIFSGRRGYYAESDQPDAEDLYGRTKFLGEVSTGTAITLRTSIIGPELGTCVSLLDWFRSQRGSRVRGFRRAIYSGFTTFEMARLVERILVRHPELKGLWQVSSHPISKYDLLCKLNDRLGLNITIDPYDDFFCDRSLDSSLFRETTGYVPPTWDEMVGEIASVSE